MPQLAPHFVDALLNNGQYAGSRIDTTLDAGLQRLIERQIHRYLDQFGERGIQNATALLLDASDMTVKAWIGSADYANEAIQGQVNGVLHPQTVLRDAPPRSGRSPPRISTAAFWGRSALRTH